MRRIVSPITIGPRSRPKVRARADERSRSISTATSGRSFPKTASSATASTKRPGRPTCGSTWPSRPSPIATACTPIVPGQPEQSEALAAHHERRRSGNDAAARFAPRAQARAKRNAASAGSKQGAAYAKHWSFIPPVKADAARSLRQGLAAQRNRPLRRSRASMRKNFSRRPKPIVARSSAASRSTSPACRLGRGSRSVRRRRIARRLRKTRRPPARQPALRRTHGPRLARRRPLRRHQRLLDRRRPPHVAVARLGHRRLQHATCRTTSSSATSSPATCCRTAPKPSSSPPASSATT